MKTAAIIAEYNPFHNGHKYHIEMTKEQTGADYIIVAMSGDFIQRGAPAIVDKYSRAEMALRGGADLVLEIPSCYSSASAEYFASAAIAMLDKLSAVDFLSFGSEEGTLDKLENIADVLITEPDNFKDILNQHLHDGRTYPYARNMALIGCLKDSQDYMGILSQPNNILAIEYLKAIKRRQSTIKPFTITRMGNEYHSKRLSYCEPNSTNFSSSTAIRTSISNGVSIEQLSNEMPEFVLEILSRQKDFTFPVVLDDFSAMLHYKLLLNLSSEYEMYSDVSKELSNRIVNKLNEYTDYSDFCDLLKTKDITYARVSRALLHILLDIKKDFYNDCVDHDYMSFAPVLGFKKSAQPLLSKISNEGTIPLLTKNADAHKILSPFAMPMFESNITTTHIYQSALANKYKKTYKNMYCKSPVIL